MTGTVFPILLPGRILVRLLPFRKPSVTFWVKIRVRVRAKVQANKPVHFVLLTFIVIMLPAKPLKSLS